MTRQLIFAFLLLITLGIFAWTIMRIIRYFRLTKPAFPVRDPGRRFKVMMDVAFGQTKIFRRPVLGFFHALVFWGFCVILFGSMEMIIDGLIDTEKALKVLGCLHDIIMASGDVFAVLVAISIIIFLSRRLFVHVKRFQGIEMKHANHIDAIVALSMIFFLLISLLGMNAAYVGYNSISDNEIHGVYPIGNTLSLLLTGMNPLTVKILYEVCWWIHIVLLFIFANILPYSKHFHVFMSVPNVFLSRLDPLGKLPNMDNVTREVRLMLNPDIAYAAPATEVPVERFGI